jgi:2-polyprenyl-3-methyl-5-hydroxy-6-metoxy-1,4-benzoquinol methylase
VELAVTGGVTHRPHPLRAADAVTFDPTAYAAWFESPLGRRVWAHEERALLIVLQPKAGWRVLDAACGDGRLLRSLAGRACAPSG